MDSHSDLECEYSRYCSRLRESDIDRLHVVMLRGLNDNSDVGGALFFKLSLPNRLTTTSDFAALSSKQILCFYFMNVSNVI